MNARFFSNPLKKIEHFLNTLNSILHIYLTINLTCMSQEQTVNFFNIHAFNVQWTKNLE